MKLNRPDVIAALVLATLATLCWVPRLKGPIDLRWDGAAYYILGTALAEGKGYRLLNEPGEIQSTLHPPMLPVLIALYACNAVAISRRCASEKEFRLSCRSSACWLSPIWRALP